MSDTSARLNQVVVPTHYDLTIRTDLQKCDFSGVVVISLDIPEPVESITVHVASPVIIHNASLTHTALKTTQAPLPLSKFRLDQVKERAELAFATTIPPGQAKLAIRFSGIVSDAMMGYYRSSAPVRGSTDSEELAYYALTQFEPTSARQAFPCFDEPAIKATFAISHISRVGLVSLSNMDVTATEHLGAGGAVPTSEFVSATLLSESVTPEVLSSKDPVVHTAPVAPSAKQEFPDDWEIVRFATTPKMSTYLVAFANGDFERLTSSYTSPLTGRSVPLGIYATHEHIAQAGLALETKVRVLPLYERFFDIAYPLPKLDTLVAADFNSGAMENWGLITGRTAVYLHDDKESDLESRKVVIGVQSHEVAHQWFGNVVTMEWWDNLWLNEAFATLIGEVIVVNEIEPSWDLHVGFITNHLSRALNLDSLRSSHAIEVPCPNEDTINQIFDYISYAKGASVLRMLCTLVGQEAFLKGVSLYLKRHLYGNARTADLWAGISEASGVDVAAFMDSWTQRVGFPVVEVKEEGTGFTLTQHRFLATSDLAPEEDTTIWQIPLEIRSVDKKTGKTGTDHARILRAREETVDLGTDTRDLIYKLNADTSGVYRVLYSPERWEKLGDQVRAFSVADRMGLVQDASVLASCGYMRTSSALSLVSKLARAEDAVQVYTEIGVALGRLTDCFWEDPALVKAVKALRRAVFAPIVARLGIDNGARDDAQTIDLRKLAVGICASAEDPKTVKVLLQRFTAEVGLSSDDSAAPAADAKSEKTGIPPDVLRATYTTAVRELGAPAYDAIWKIYEQPPTLSHRLAAMDAICVGTDSKLHERTFEALLSGKIKPQDMAKVFSGLAGNPSTRVATWNFFKENWPKIDLVFRANFAIGFIVIASFSSLTTQASYDDVVAFFKDKDTGLYVQQLDQGLDAVKAKIAWIGRDKEDVENWLKENKYWE